ncbi:MAG: DNA alkylation repair protein [Bacteroidota bacterium]
MSTLLKDLYKKKFYNSFSIVLENHIPDFDKKKFITMIFSSDFEAMELKERMRHTATTLHHFLPDDFEHSITIIKNCIHQIQSKDNGWGSIEYLFFPDYIERFGINHYEISATAIEFVTQFITCEFAVRPFIIKYPNKILSQLKKWAKHPNAKVRRLATEGIRPRLPWAMALPEFKRDPSQVLEILEILKNDESEFVRRSVANNLNDISKDHPALVIEIAKRWKGISVETDNIIKHASRTLLKQGHTDILNHFGLDSKNILVENFKIGNSNLKIGDNLSFSFELQNLDKKSKYIRLEYAIYFLRQNGTYGKKVFKISEREFEKNSLTQVSKNHSFRVITTKKYYLGKQYVSIIINGKESKKTEFYLV